MKPYDHGTCITSNIDTQSHTVVALVSRLSENKSSEEYMLFTTDLLFDNSLKYLRSCQFTNLFLIREQTTP